MNEDQKILYLKDYTSNQNLVEPHEYISTQIQSRPTSEILARSFAFFIDMMVILLLNYTVHAAYGLFINQFLHPMNNASKLLFIEPQLSQSILVFLTLYTSYFLYTGVVLNGKTIGKMIFKLSVVNENFITNHLENTHETTMKQALYRAIGYLTCYLSFGTFFIFHLASEDNRGLPDYLSSTRTVTDEWLNSMLEHKEFSAQEVTIDIRSLDKAA